MDVPWAHGRPEPIAAEAQSRVPAGFTVSLLIVVALAVVFDYINGFHDTANAIATSVATRALRPQVAVLMATAFNFIGAFAGTAVAKTIGSGLVDDATTTQAIVAAALIGAIAWNLITWWYSLPSSSSHALIGGLLGATIVAAGVGALKIQGIVDKVLIPMVTSPIIGFLGALILMVVIDKDLPPRQPQADGPLVPTDAGLLGGLHGLRTWFQRRPEDDGYRHPCPVRGRCHPSVEVPWWVIVVAATAISLGTAIGGWRIMKTMGQRVVELEPVHGFAAETTAATVLLGTAQSGDACVDHPRHFQFHHGRRHQPGRPRRPVGRGAHHPRGVGADPPCQLNCSEPSRGSSSIPSGSSHERPVRLRCHHFD